MSIPRLVPQTAGKLTLKRHKGSQLVINHNTSSANVAHLEELTTLLTEESKKSYESFVASCRNDVKLCRADNGSFSDKEFMDHILQNKQSLELCAVGEHHQNDADERAIRTITESTRAMLLSDRRLWPEAITQLLWLFALSHAVHIHNHLHIDKNGTTPIAIFFNKGKP